MSVARTASRAAALFGVCAALATVPTVVIAQAPPAPAPKAEQAGTGEGHHMSGWKEMDAFHMVMMETWHPAKATGDLKPIRAKAGTMAEKAQAWAAATVPAACDKPETREALKLIAADSRALADLVARQGSDAEVKSALAALHDRFEPIEHGCKPAKHSHH
jgi:hypothetical protein